MAAVTSGKFLFLGGHATKRGVQSGGTTSEIAHKWAQWQSEVGKLIFWVINVLGKKKFLLLSNLLSKIFFLLSKLLSEKKIYSVIYLVENPPPEEKLRK